MSDKKKQSWMQGNKSTSRREEDVTAKMITFCGMQD
jgi:hypothetical protein